MNSDDRRHCCGRYIIRGSCHLECFIAHYCVVSIIAEVRLVQLPSFSAQYSPLRAPLCTVTRRSKPMAEKDPITCHVLDTLTGRPATGIFVQLSHWTKDGPAAAEFKAVAEGQTNADGRISKWNVPPGCAAIATIIAGKESHNGGSGGVWQLRFDTGNYYGPGKTFWPWVELSFFVRPGEHYHVPLLLGPYSYTTYRGS